MEPTSSSSSSAAVPPQQASEGGVDLGVLVRQVARVCHEDLRKALASPAGSARESLQDALAKAKSRLLRLSLVLQECGQDGCLLSHASMLMPAMVDKAESHSAHLQQCGERLGRLRAEFCQALATRQPNVAAAAALLQGGNVQGIIGLPAMAGDVIASLGQGPRAVWTLPAEQQAATRRRVQLGVLCSVARSSCCQAFQHEDKDRRMLLELPDDGSVQLQAPDEFSLHLAFDLSRWSVLGASLAPQGLGSVLSVGKEGEQSLCRQLQAAADSQPPEAEGGDALAAICSAAQTFISHLWLRAMHDESLRLLAVPGISGQAEISSSFWDRRGFVLLRICPDWDATVGGLCVDIALPGGRSLTNAPRDFADLRGFASGRGSRAPGQDVAGFNGVVTSGGMSSSSSTSGCALELHS
ncbi:unnamed protein product, partial [Polarella glacialis]